MGANSSTSNSESESEPKSDSASESVESRILFFFLDFFAAVAAGREGPFFPPLLDALTRFPAAAGFA